LFRIRVARRDPSLRCAGERHLRGLLLGGRPAGQVEEDEEDDDEQGDDTGDLPAAGP
jgi:hypothetical protein